MISKLTLNQFSYFTKFQSQFNIVTNVCNKIASAEQRYCVGIVSSTVFRSKAFCAFVFIPLNILLRVFLRGGGDLK